MYGQPGQPSYILLFAPVEKPCSVRYGAAVFELPPTEYHAFAVAQFAVPSAVSIAAWSRSISLCSFTLRLPIGL